MREPLITQLNPPPGMIDLGMGIPDQSLLPVAAIQKSAAAYFSGADPRPLQYGIEQGNGYFRRALAAYLSAAYRAAVDPEHLYISAGASSALDRICTLYTQPGDTIFVEQPTYFLALRIFEDHQLRLESIPVDRHGFDIAALDEMLSRHRPKFIYTIPTFQNPSGFTLSAERRSQLVARARQHDILLVADEVYHLLHYNQEPPAPLALHSGEVEQVISVNSFSKVLAPGLRLGWLQAHPKVIQCITGSGMLDSGGGMNPFLSALLLDLIESGDFQRNIESLRQEYSQRLRVMDAALKKYLPSAEYDLPQGGFYFWVRLPGVDTAELKQRALAFNVGLQPGISFTRQADHDRVKEYMRLGFCFYSPEDIEEGIRRIASALNQK